MMANWLEVGVWVVALLLVHEGLMTKPQAPRNRVTQAMPYVGAGILLVGAGLLHWNAQGARQLANMLQTPPVVTNADVHTEDFAKLPLVQRREFSIQLAKAVFVSGGALVDVVGEEGEWVPYSPSLDDVKAHDHQLGLNSQVTAGRQALMAEARMAENCSMRWIVSLVIAVCTGLAASRLRSRIPRG